MAFPRLLPPLVTGNIKGTMAESSGRPERSPALNTNPVFVRFLQNLIAERPRERRAPGAAGHLANAYDIGTCALGTVTYSPQDFERAERLLAAAGQPLAAPDKGVRRGTVVTRLSLEHEAPVAPVRDRLVAMAMTQRDWTLPAHAHFAGVDAADAVRMKSEAILVCETIDTLARFWRFPWVERKLRGRRTLAVFAGGRSVFRTAAVRTLLEGSRVPVLRLASFSTQGLLDAASTPRLEDICWPDEEQLHYLARRSSPSSAYIAQMRRAAPALSNNKHPAIAAGWEKVQRYRAGISCDHFVAETPEARRG